MIFRQKKKSIVKEEIITLSKGLSLQQRNENAERKFDIELIRKSISWFCHLTCPDVSAFPVVRTTELSGVSPQKQSESWFGNYDVIISVHAFLWFISELIFSFSFSLTSTLLICALVMRTKFLFYWVRDSCCKPFSFILLKLNTYFLMPPILQNAFYSLFIFVYPDFLLLGLL